MTCSPMTGVWSALTIAEAPCDLNCRGKSVKVLREVTIHEHTNNKRRVRVSCDFKFIRRLLEFCR